MKKIKKILRRKKNYTFLKNILSSAIGTTIAVMIIFFMIILIIFNSISNPKNKIEGEIKPNSVLKIKLNYPVYDSQNTNFNTNNILTNINNDKNNPLNLFRIIEAINKASKNKNINGILLDLDEFIGPGGWSSLKEIRDALVRFKKSEKFIWSYSKNLSQSAYYLASVSDSVITYPQTGVDFRGLSMTSFFLTDLFNEIGIKPEIIRSGKYKAAVEPFILKKMSKENKEQSELLLYNIWNDVVNDIGKSRNLNIEELNLTANQGIDNWSLNKNSILIDTQKYPQEFIKSLKKKINNTKNDVLNLDQKISFVSLNDILKSSTEFKSENKIGIIYAEGQISDSDNDQISPQSHSKIIRELKEDENIKAVVLRVNSPGGSALASDMIWNELEELKKIKPLIVSMGDVAASGGYYISCNANKIFASNSTITGSIGVFGLFFKIENLLKNKMNIHFDEINTNKYSNFGSIYELFDESEKEMLGDLIDQTYDTFLRKVSNGRNINIKEINDIAQGRIWSGLEAKKIGLIDEIGGLSDAINYAVKVTKLEDYVLEEYPKKKDFFQILLEDLQSNYKLYDNLQLYVQNWETEKFRNLIKNYEGIQTRIPYELNIK